MGGRSKRKSTVGVGVDIGSQFVKTVISRDRRILSVRAERIHNRLGQSIRRAVWHALREAEVGPLQPRHVALTGDRHHLKLPFPYRYPARCLTLYFGETHPGRELLILSAGNISMEASVLSRKNKVLDVYKNDRCAAGVGRFVEAACRLLKLDISRGIEPLEALARQGRNPIRFSPGCIVFSESEVISMVSSGAAPADILGGVLHLAAEKVATLYDSYEHSFQGRVVFTGGLARIPLIRESLAAQIEQPLLNDDLDPWFHLAAGASFA